jgi:hypothetical protein
MSAWLWRITFFIGSLSLLGISSPAPISGPNNAKQIANTESVIEQKISTAMEGYIQFQSSRSPESLQSSSRALLGSLDVNGISAKDALAVRRSFLLNYAKLLQAISSIEDPGFELGDRKFFAYTCIPVPIGPGGRPLPDCANPSLIPDLATRNKYIEMQKANREVADRGAKEFRLRLIDQEIMGSLRAILESLRSKAPSDDAYLDAIMSRSGISSDKQDKIRAWYR